MAVVERTNRVSLAEAKAKLSSLINRVEAGEEIEISRHGKAAVKLVRIEKPKKAVDIEWLRSVTAGMTPQAESAGEFIRRMRDEDRY